MAFNFGSFLEMQVLTFLRAFLVFFFSLKKACKWESTIPLCLAAHHCMTSPRFSGLPVTSRWEAADKDSLGFPSALNIADFPGPHEKLLGLTSYSLRCCCLVGLRTGLLRLQAWTFLSAQLDSDRSIRFHPCLELVASFGDKKCLAGALYPHYLEIPFRLPF